MANGIAFSIATVARINRGQGPFWAKLGPDLYTHIECIPDRDAEGGPVLWATVEAQYGLFALFLCVSPTEWEYVKTIDLTDVEACSPSHGPDWGVSGVQVSPEFIRGAAETMKGVYNGWEGLSTVRVHTVDGNETRGYSLVLSRLEGDDPQIVGSFKDAEADLTSPRLVSNFQIEANYYASFYTAPA